MITTRAKSLALLIPLLLCSMSTSFAQAKNKTVENFGRLEESTALSWDHSTIRAFCRLKDDFVVERVLDAYKKGRRAHGVQLRALLMNELTLRGIKNENEHQLIKKFFDGVSKKEEHNWAAHQCAVMLLRFGKDQAELNKIIEKDKAIWRRVAVIEAYGRSDKRDWLKHCKEWEAKLMKLKADKRDTALISLAWSVARVAKKPKPKPVPPVRPKRPVPPRGKVLPPKKPAAPGQPGATPGKPGAPGKPGTPATPKKPEMPGSPGAPVKPVAPKVTPKTPVKKPVKKPVKYDPVYKNCLPSLEMVINWLDIKKMSIKTKRKIARALQHAFETDEAPTDSQAWMPRLQGKNSVVKGSTVVRGASFMSIDADGDRLLFLVDASDSMLKPLTEAERKAFRRLFPPSEKKSVERNWRGVKTRFDAAKVNLIATLKKLDSKQFFAIIWFGDKARICPATKGFLKASKKNVRGTIATLQKFQPNAATTMKPIGTLLGQTNYYQGFHNAFMHSVRGRVKTDHPEVHKGLIRFGADMIFLLSDGVPNKDGFMGQSPAMEYERTIYKRIKTGERMVNQDYRDPETGVVVKRPPIMMPTYKHIPNGKVKETRRMGYSQGPYVADAEILKELERLNLVRKVTIHAISLGETRKTLLQQIAKKGYGKFVEVTK